jgi:hypothetical protein
VALLFFFSPLPCYCTFDASVPFSFPPVALRLRAAAALLLVACRDRLCSLYQRLNFLTIFCGWIFLTFSCPWLLLIESCTMLLWNIYWNFFWWKYILEFSVSKLQSSLKFQAFGFISYQCPVMIDTDIKFCRFCCGWTFRGRDHARNILAHMVSKHAVTIHFQPNKILHALGPRTSGMQSSNWTPPLRKGQLSWFLLF